MKEDNHRQVRIELLKDGIPTFYDEEALSFIPLVTTTHKPIIPIPEIKWQSKSLESIINISGFLGAVLDNRNCFGKLSLDEEPKPTIVKCIRTQNHAIYKKYKLKMMKKRIKKKSMK